MRLLLIDDDQDIHGYYKAVFGAVSCIKKVITVATPEQFAKALIAKPDLFIVDICLEQPIDGLQLIQKHKDDIGQKPIIIMSAMDDIHLAVQKLQAQGFKCHGAFQKPISLLEIGEFFGESL